MNIDDFFIGLGKCISTEQKKTKTELGKLFAELAPRLETARVLGRELDRMLARRFNVFDYLRTDELGLSRIIADLLDPGASHGQGTLFLRALMDGLNGLTMSVPDEDVDSATIKVEVERQITKNRRLDISVEIGRPGTYCLAIENKPWAGDQQNQVTDYLDFLKEKYRKFLLVYLSAQGQGPSDWSIKQDDLRKWKDNFVIMQYCAASQEAAGDDGEAETDGFHSFRADQSLAVWFQTCRRDCEVDRLRWFLRDAELFCEKSFGG